MVVGWLARLGARVPPRSIVATGAAGGIAVGGASLGAGLGSAAADGGLLGAAGLGGAAPGSAVDWRVVAVLGLVVVGVWVASARRVK